MPTVSNQQTTRFIQANYDYLTGRLLSQEEEQGSITWEDIRQLVADYIDEEQAYILSQLPVDNMDTFARSVIEEGYEAVNVREVADVLAAQQLAP